MGDVTDMILDGALCKDCGVLIDGEMPGWTRRCQACRPKPPVKGERPTTVTNCPTCNRRVKRAGLGDHMRTKHPPESDIGTRQPQ